MLSKYTKGNLEVLQGLITKRIIELNDDIEDTKDNISISKSWGSISVKYRERLNRLDDECSFLEDLAECIESMLERGERRE